MMESFKLCPCPLPNSFFSALKKLFETNWVNLSILENFLLDILGLKKFKLTERLISTIYLDVQLITEGVKS